MTGSPNWAHHALALTASCGASTFHAAGATVFTVSGKSACFSGCTAHAASVSNAALASTLTKFGFMSNSLMGIGRRRRIAERPRKQHAQQPDHETQRQREESVGEREHERFAHQQRVQL